MPVTVTEKFESRAGGDDQIDLIYVVEGTDDDVAARAALSAQAPATYGALVRQTPTIEPVGPALWEGKARYVKADFQAPQTGEASFSFDTTGGTQHITQSLSTVHTYAAMTPTYIGHLYALTGKVNNATFTINVDGVVLQFQAGECLFLGASGGRRGTEDWEIGFRFSANPNANSLSIGSISGVNKKGWEYLWVRYADAEDADAKAVVKRPIAAYVEKVYDDGNFALLNP